MSVIGVYGGFIDKFPMGAIMNRSLTIRTGQCHVQRYMRPLLERIERREIDRASSSPTGCGSTTPPRATASSATSKTSA